jgi:signal transduction histidine kinase
VGTDTLGSLVGATLLGACAFYAVDILLLAAVIARVQEQSYARAIGAYFGSTVVPFVIMASLTATLVLIWDRSPVAAVVLVAPLLVIAFYQRWLYGALTRLRAFDELKDEFIAVISHELRTPLSSVYGAAVTLQKQDLPPDTRRSLLAIVTSEAGRLGRLLDDVLWASRLDTGHEEFTIRPTDGEHVAREVLEGSQPRLPEGLTIDLEAQESLPRVAADADKLRQVLLNLVENAIKYSPAGGRVTMLVQRSGEFVRFSVRDEGLGIPVHERERIFEKFHRLDPELTGGVGGTGLGLYVCRELVERMGGEIWVRSSGGRGSTFAFELPAAA